MMISQYIYIYYLQFCLFFYASGNRKSSEVKKMYFKKQHANVNTIEMNENRFRIIFFGIWNIVMLQTLTHSVKCIRCANFYVSDH